MTVRFANQDALRQLYGAGHREPTQREHLADLRCGADRLVRMLAALPDDEGARPLLLEIAQQCEGMRRAASLAAHVPNEGGPGPRAA